MNYIDFENCRIFLEKMIEQKPDNSELIKAYITLIEKKSDFDISWLKTDEELRKDFEKTKQRELRHKLKLQKLLSKKMLIFLIKPTKT